MEEMKFLLWSITVSEILRKLDLWYWNMSRQDTGAWVDYCSKIKHIILLTPPPTNILGFLHMYISHKTSRCDCYNND